MTQQNTSSRAEQFKADPCRFLDLSIKSYVRTSPLNHLTAFHDTVMIEEPVVAFADGDDPLFQDLKTIIGEFHLTPREVMERYVKSKGWRFGSTSSLGRIGVVSWALPIARDTRITERSAPFGGSPRYNHTRWRGIKLFDDTAQHVASLLEVMGYNAVAPTRSRLYEEKQMPEGWRAVNWSERHVAYACGLGTFGLNGLIITPRGCAVYLGSVVFDQAVTPTPRYPSRVANCLFYQNKSCRQCIDRCIASAISEDGRSNIKCLKNLRENQLTRITESGLDKDLVGPAAACGRCSTGVPCEDRIPTQASANGN